MKKYLLVLLIPLFAFGLSKPLSQKGDDNKCLVCHANAMAGKIAHKPVSQSCESCHKSNGNEHPKADVKGFTLVKEMPDLCYTCHTPLNTKKIVHAVVSNGKCMLCHAPHASDNASLLKENPVGKICEECHDDLELGENTSKHMPVADGKCQACHDPHQSDNEKLVKLEGQELCYQCHAFGKADLTQKSVHPPFANKCVICHKPHGSKIEPMLTQKMPDLCYGCHDDMQETVEKAPFSHLALKDGKSCSNCHSPHSSPNDSLVKTEPIAKICLNCHNNLALDAKKVKHGAVTAGKCNACHDPHKGDNKNLVKAPTPELCVKCHDQARAELAMTNTHPPAKNNCSICHVAHGSDEQHMLTKNLTELCLGCHDDFEEPMQKSASIHQPLKDAGACITCHSPHGSMNGKLLLKDQQALCLGCHNKSIKKGNKVTLNMKQFLQKNKYVHGAIAKDGCTGCHNPHFSDNNTLLTGKFNSDFYIPAVKDSVALCFNCHDSKLMTSPVVSTETSFRNGDKNLHFVHINGSKGRNCTVCHDVHASNNKHLIMEKTQFGDWSMTMNYIGTDNGGSCQTGCHGLKQYKR